MSTAESGRVGRLLVTLGMLGNAFSKWFLVWLFARTAGGAEAVGMYSLVLAVGTPIFVIAQMGLRMIVVSLETTRPWAYYVRLRTAGNILGTLALLLFGVLSSSVTMELVAAVTLLKVCDSFSDIVSAKMQYFNQMRTIGAISVACAVVTVIVSTVIVQFTGSVELALIGAAAASAVATVVEWRFSKKFSFENEKKDGAYQEIFRSSVPVAGSELMASLLFQIPVLIVGALGNPEMVGVFAAAQYLLIVASLLGSAMQNVLVTPFRLMRKNNGVAEIDRRVTALSRQISLLCLVAIGIVIVFGSDVLVLIYGEEFAIDRWSLAFLSIGAAGTIVAYIFSVTLNVFNRYGAVTWSLLFSCVLTVVASLVAYFMGANAVLAGSVGAGGGAIARVLVLWANTRFEVRRLEKIEHQKAENRSNVRSEENVGGESSI